MKLFKEVRKLTKVNVIESLQGRRVGVIYIRSELNFKISCLGHLTISLNIIILD